MNLKTYFKKIRRNKSQPSSIYLNHYSLPECTPFPSTVTLCKTERTKCSVDLMPLVYMEIRQSATWSTVNWSRLGPYPALTGSLEFLNYVAARAAAPCDRKICTKKCKEVDILQSAHLIRKLVCLYSIGNIEQLNSGFYVCVSGKIMQRFLQYLSLGPVLYGN